ncbi:MAG: hemolysin III family protein [Leptospira sp.]|nr:hemolysin III family protein [Leptospira sp.]
MKPKKKSPAKKKSSKKTLIKKSNNKKAIGKQTVASLELKVEEKNTISEFIDTVREYSIGHEVANAITHGIGGALSIAGLSVLVTMAVLFGDSWRVISCAIYGSTLVLLYIASTLYHAIQHEKAKFIFKNLDHASIFLLIAGTYTPFTLVSLRESSKWGWILFIVIWVLAFIGVTIKALFPKRMSHTTVAIYILMGWLCVFALGDIYTVIGKNGMVWLVAGGLSYTLGVIFYAWDNLPFNHAIWHLFVLSGSFCHFFAIWFYVLPMKNN